MKRTLLGLLGLLLLAAPAAVQAQFKYTTNNGAITLTGYAGTGGAVVISNFVTSIGTNAFASTSLTTITIPAGVTSIGDDAFAACSVLTNVYFTGNAPGADSTVFQNDTHATIYYLPGTSGWSSPFAGLPSVMLNAPSPAGSLQVSISPAGAITAGARWSVDSGVPQPSGATVVGLSVGNHTLSFSTIGPWWTTPSNQTISISANATANAIGTYVLPAPLTVSGTPATFTDVFPAASPPIPGPNDIYQTNIWGEIISSAGINYYTDAMSADSGGLMCGTTFVTGSNPGGYVVTNVFVTSVSRRPVGGGQHRDLHLQRPGNPAVRRLLAEEHRQWLGHSPQRREHFRRHHGSLGHFA